MSDMYAIKGSTLTAMGDAIRRYTLGEPELYNEYYEMRYDDGTYPLQYYKHFYQYKTEKTKIIIKNITNANGDSNFYNSESVGRIGIIKTQSGAYPTVSDVDIFVPKDTVFPFEATTNYSRFTIFYDADATHENVFVDIEFIPLKKDGTEIKYTPSGMVEEINNFVDEYNNAAIINEEDLVISGSCEYRFAEGGWNWFIENYGDKITTNDITNCRYMFDSADLKEIPFDINCRWYETTDMTNMFRDNYIKTPPKLDKVKPSAMPYLFYGCNYLKSIPEDWCDNWDWSYLEGLTSSYLGQQNQIFANCSSLRSYPNSIFSHGNPIINYNYCIYNYQFNCCYVLDEVIDLSFPHYDASWTSNGFNTTFDYCNRLKNITFKLQDDGTPYVMKWKNQTIDLTKFVGYGSGINSILNNQAHHGITADKQITDDTTYQALKDDPDWFTIDINYSRYNHDSAVNTINSLPDCSATGTNTIKFKGASGALTDGGAINTLTEEEIAVAVAKGWTVSLV